MGANCSNITYNDDNLTMFVWNTMGQRCLSPTMVTVTGIFYSLILLLGICGNIFTCLVIAKNASMHTATNYYLFSLAVSDLLSLVLGLPFELRSSMTTLWPDILPEVFCKVRSTVTEMTSYASVLTITAFSIERWLAICFPLKVKIFSKLDRAVKVIIAIWVLALVCALPMYTFTVLNRLPLPPGLVNDTSATDDGVTVKLTDFCALDITNVDIQKYLINFSFWVFFIAPLLIISVLYTHIGLTINKASKDTIRHDLKKLRRRKTVINMLVSVVVAFFICWLPFHVQRISTLYFDFMKLGPNLLQFFSVIFYVSGYFYYANAAVNPILYSVLNNRFRKAFMSTLCFCVKQARKNTLQRWSPHNPAHGNCNSNSTLTSAPPRGVLRRHVHFVKRSSELSNSSTTQFETLQVNNSIASVRKQYPAVRV